LTAQQDIVKLELQNVFSPGHAQIDGLRNGSVECAILVPSHINIIKSSLKGHGSFLWALIEAKD
jgi:hypothetical protein